MTDEIKKLYLTRPEVAKMLEIPLSRFHIFCRKYYADAPAFKQMRIPVAEIEALKEAYEKERFIQSLSPMVKNMQKSFEKRMEELNSLKEKIGLLNEQIQNL